MKKETKKYNKENVFSIKQVVVFTLLCILFLSLILAFTLKTGLEGEKDIKEREESIASEKEAVKWFSIDVNEHLYKEGFLIYGGEVYYRLYDIYIIEEDLLGNYLIDCERFNMNVQDGVYQYEVKEGFKYKNTVGGKIYECTSSNDMVLLMIDYDGVNFNKSNCFLYVKEEVYNEYKQKIKSITNITSDDINNVKYIFFEGENTRIPDVILETEESRKFINSLEKFEKSFIDDNLIIDEPYYYIYKMYIIYNDLFAYKYDALYKVEDHTMYIQESLDEDTATFYGLSAEVGFINN